MNWNYKEKNILIGTSSCALCRETVYISALPLSEIPLQYISAMYVHREKVSGPIYTYPDTPVNVYFEDVYTDYLHENAENV